MRSRLLLFHYWHWIANESNGKAKPGFSFAILFVLNALLANRSLM
jgi:hypothetical protein